MKSTELFSLSNLHMGIRWKLILPFLIVTAVSAAFLLPITREQVTSTIETETDRLLVDTSASVTALLESTEQQALLSAQFAANLPSVHLTIDNPDIQQEILANQKDTLGLQELSLYAADFQPSDQALYYGGPSITRRFQTSQATIDIRDALIQQVIATGEAASAIAIAPQSSQILGAAPIHTLTTPTQFHGIILTAFYMNDSYIANLGDLVGAELAIVNENAVIVSTIDRSSGYEQLLQAGFLHIGEDHAHGQEHTVLPEGTFSNAYLTYDDGSQYRLIGTPITIDEIEQGFLLVATPVDNLFTLVDNIQLVVIAFAGFFAIMSIGIGIAALVAITRPISRLAEAATQMSHGDLDQQVPISYLGVRDEITDLSENFNQMATRLKDSYDSLEERVETRTQELVEERNKLDATSKNLAEARDDAVSANQAKSEFVSLVSHELKIPMTSIKGYTDLMLGGMAGELSPQQTEFLETVRNNVGRMVTLVSDLADISRIETGNLRIETTDVDLCEVIDEVLKATETQINDKKQALETDEVSDDLPELYCDRVRLNQILTNLLSNANKYTPEGGSIKISAKQLTANGLSNAIQIAVTDSGYGISTEEQEKLFEKFFRSDDMRARQAPGTGLGLNITKNLVELQGGEIWFESTLNKGTTFFFTLPVSQK